LLRWEERAAHKELLVNALSCSAFYQVVEKVGFPRLVKNAQMQGSRNPPEVRRTSGYAATTKEEGYAAEGRFSTAC
jgi:hypothetical protein